MSVEEKSRERHREAVALQVRELEERRTEQLDELRLAKAEWEEYSFTMQNHARRLEELSLREDGRNYFVQRKQGARSEVQAYVSQIARQQIGAFDDAEREIRSRSDEELERLQREKAGA